MTSLFGFLPLAISLASTAAEPVAHKRADVIKIDNVCINIRFGYEYTIISSVDYFRVDVVHGGVRGHVYVGYNPQILDENRKWQSSSLRASMKSSKVVRLVGDQAGQILGVPVHEEDQYFHLWFEKNEKGLTAPIEEVVDFCK